MNSNLGDNTFEGQVPASFGKLYSLEKLYGSLGLATYTINHAHLIHRILHENQFTEISEELLDLKDLKILYA